VGQGDGEEEGFSGAEEAVDMLLEFKDAAIIGADALEDTVAIEQSVVEDADFGVLFVVVLAVDVDFHAEITGKLK
jgi:hypothetical protein